MRRGVSPNAAHSGQPFGTCAWVAILLFLRRQQRRDAVGEVTRPRARGVIERVHGKQGAQMPDVLAREAERLAVERHGCEGVTGYYLRQFFEQETEEMVSFRQHPLLRRQRWPNRLVAHGYTSNGSLKGESMRSIAATAMSRVESMSGARSGVGFDTTVRMCAVSASTAASIFSRCVFTRCPPR